MKFKLLIVALFWFNQNFSQTISVEYIKKHISVLSNDSLQGRGTGTIGEAKAANYISQEFKMKFHKFNYSYVIIGFLAIIILFYL